MRAHIMCEYAFSVYSRDIQIPKLGNALMLIVSDLNVILLIYILYIYILYTVYFVVNIVLK